MMRVTPSRGIGALLFLVLGACGASTASTQDGPGTLGVTLGYLPNLTQATALVGIQQDIFRRELGPDVRFQTVAFNAGPAAVEALFNGAVDAAYIGANPGLNAHARSRGKAIRIVSGATSGGAFLVVRPEIADASALRGRTLATPQLGNTQDVALRTWLHSMGLETDLNGGGDTSVVPQDNAQTLDLFRSGAIDGAWVPEPWATRLVQEGGGRVLVDERDLWPEGRYVTTNLVVRTELLEAHPEAVAALVRGQVATNAFLHAHPLESQTIANEALGRITGKKLKESVLRAAWSNLTFTNDPLAESLATSARNAAALRLLDPVELRSLYALAPLAEALRTAGVPEVPAP